MQEEDQDIDERSRTRVAWSKSVELMPADSIVVRESTNTVNISERFIIKD